MPVYELTSAKTGQNYRVDFDRDPVEADVDEAVNYFDNEFARQNGVAPEVLDQGPLGTVINKVRDVGPAVVGGLMETGGNLLGAGARLVGLPDSLPQGIAGLGADLQDEGRRLRPTNPANVTANTIGSGLQQGIGLVATMGAAAPVVGVKAALGTVPLVMGGIQGGGQGVMTARDMGIESPAGQLGMGAAFGAAEMLAERMGGAGSKALTEAVQRGVASTLKQAGKTMGSEAVEEPVTGFAQDAATWLGGQAVEDPNRPGFTTTGYELPKLDAAMLERRKQEAIGGAAGGTVFAGLQLALPNNDTLPPNQTPAQAGTTQAPGTTPATAAMAGGAGAVPSTLSRIAQESLVPDLPEFTGELTAEDVQDLEGVGQSMSDPSTLQVGGAASPMPGAFRVTGEGSTPSPATSPTASVTEESSVTADQTAQPTPGAGLSPAAGSFSPAERSPEAQAYAQAVAQAAEEARQAQIARLRMIDNKAQGMPLIPDSPRGDRDILDFANENPIYLPPGFSEERNLPEYEKLKEAKLPAYWRQFVASSKRGGNPEQVAQRAYDAGLISEPDAGLYLDAVREGIDSRKQYRVDFAAREKALETEEKQVIDFEKTQQTLRRKDKERVRFEDIAPGDEMTIDGEKAVVKNIEYTEDGYLTNVVIEDGKRFGLMQFDPQNRQGIFVDEFTPKQREQPGDAEEPLFSRAAPRLDFSGLMQNAQAVASGAQAPQTSAALGSMINAPGQRSGPVPAQAGPRGVNRFFPASSNQQPGSSILPAAYREATRGSSTQMAPLSSVYSQARLLQPGLTPEAFLAQVQDGYNNGTLYLEGAGSQQEAQQASLSLPGTPVGTAVRMMPVPQADRAQRINPYGMQRRNLPKAKPKETRATPTLTNPDSTLANALQPETEVPAAMRGVVFNAISSLESLWGLSLGKVQTIGLKLIPKSSRDHGEYVVRGHIALNDNLSDAQLANTAVHEFAHHLHHAHTPGSGFDLEQHAPLKQLMGVLTRTASFKELQIAARANTGSQTKMAKWLRYAADPKELLARSIERATAKLAGRAQPNYGDANVYTLLTDAEIDAIIPYVRSYFQSLSVGSVLPENRQSELGDAVGQGRGTTGPDEVSGRSVGTAGIGDSGGIGDEVARSTPAPERRENRSAFARPEQEQRMYEVQGNDIMQAEAAQWLATVDNATAVQQLESGLPPAGLRKDHLPALAERTMQRLVQTMASDKELVRLQAEALLDRAGIAWQDVINREAGRGLQQVGAANARLLPIAPILATKRILVQRAEVVMDKRFEGGAEGAVEKVKVIIQKADTQASQEVAQAVQDTVEMAPPVDPAAARAAVNAITQTARTYFGGTLPPRVKILHQEQAEWDARMNGNVLELNAAALETSQVVGKIEHEIGHLLFQDPAMRQQFDALWNSLDVNERAQIENITAALYDAANRNEEASVRALDAVRQMVEAKNPGLWQRFVTWLKQAWERLTGRLPRDPRRLAAVMIETGVARLKGVEGNQTDVRESRRSDLLKVNSPQLAKLLNSLRTKVAPGMKWADIFTEMPAAQLERQREIYKRLMQHKALVKLSANERLQLTNELDKAWQRARKKVFDKELDKAGVLGEKDASDRKKAKAVLPKMLRMINLGMFDSAAWRDAVAPQYGLRMLTSADTAQLRTLAEAAWKLPEGVIRNQKLRDLLNAIQKKTGASWIEVLNSYWTAAVLSGLRTQFDTWMAAINGMGTNLMQIGGLMARGQGRAAIDAHAQWWRGLFEGVRESGQILFKGDTSYLKRFGADLKKALEGETSVTPVPLGENLWQNGNTFQKYGLAPVMMFTGRLMAAADHINNTATTQGAIAVARALHPELYQGKVGFTETERADARTQALREVTGGNEPQTSQERATVSARTREILNGTVKPADYAAATEIGDMAAYQNDPTGLFGVVYSAMKQGLGSIQRGLGDYAEDVTANRFTRVVSGMMAGSLHGITGTRFMRFGANFGADLTRYIPGSYVLGKAGFYGRGVSRMQQELLLGKNLVGLMLASTLAAVFLNSDDEDEGWQIEGDWSTLNPQQAKERMAAGYERLTMWKRDGDQVRRVSYKQWPTMGLFAVVGGMLDEKRHKPASWAEHGTAGHLLRGVATGYTQIKNVSAVRNLVELFGEPTFSADAVSGTIDKMIKIGTNFTGGFMPTLIKDAETWTDPRSFKPEGTAELMLRSVPFARKFVNDGRPQLNLLGEEVKLQRAPWSRAYTSVESAEAHRVLGALLARGLALPMPSDQVTIIKDNVRVPLETLGRDAVWKYEKAVGQGYKEWLHLEGSDLLKLPVQEADARIKSRAEAIKARAKASVVR
jgi:hypothetical protein